MAKRCKLCPNPVSNRKHWYCDACRAARKRHKARERERLRNRGVTMADRGYGPEHRKLRRQLDPVVKSGRAVCWRCGKPISPFESWDLGHDDIDRSVYRGPEHRACNRSTSGRQPAPARHSRRW